MPSPSNSVSDRATNSVAVSAEASAPTVSTVRKTPNLTSSVGKSTFLGIIANAAQVGTRLFTVPIVIHHLGLGGYGIWNIIMMTATYMRFGSVGIKSAFQKYVAESTGSGEYTQANRLLSTGCAVMFVFSVLVLIPVSFFSKKIALAAGVPPEFLLPAAGSISLLAGIMAMANIGAPYEAIVMGGHRVDLVRRFGTVLTISEAVCIVVALRLGYGLFTMSAIMGASELLYITCCYIAARKVVPEIRVSVKNITSRALPELFRFAGSYQLVNILEVLYSSIVPFAILRTFGADPAGIYGVVARVVSSAVILQDSFLSPILSGGTMVHATGSAERMQRLLVKAFKVTLGLSLLPLGFIAVFGSQMAFAWTGQSNSAFERAFWLVCATSFFRSFSMLSLVLYRVSGKALLDNVRQVLRIVILLMVALIAPKLGFLGVLAGLATAEFVGMVFMLFALMHTFRHFHVGALLPDGLRLTGAAILILGTGVLASHFPLPGSYAGQTAATFRICEVALASALVAWPALRLTGSITLSEGKALLDVFRLRRVPAQTTNSGN
jgi:O-antigen/teichoic acid export membrane protein